MSDEQILKLMEKLNDIDKRMAKMEVLMQERHTDIQSTYETIREMKKRISDLESHKDSFIGGKDIVTWLAIVGVMIWEVLAK